MIVLTNNTKSNSVLGKLVSVDPNNPSSFIYTTPNSLRATGVVMESIGYRQKCKIATIGDTAKVLVQGNVTKDSIIRSAKSGDNVSLGSCVVAKSTDTSYLKIGTALSSGSGLIDTILELSYDSGGSMVGAVTDGTYTIGLGISSDGIITIAGGVITNIIEAT